MGYPWVVFRGRGRAVPCVLNTHMKPHSGKLSRKAESVQNPALKSVDRAASLAFIFGEGAVYEPYPGAASVGIRGE